MKRKIFLFALALPLALSAAIRYSQKPVSLTAEDGALVFPATNSCEKIRLHESGVVYGEAWANGTLETPDEFLGYIFLKTVKHEDAVLDILVGVNKSGVIQGVKVKGGEEIAEEFLAQFHGKTAQHDFEVACTPNDLLYIPLKIKALRSNIPLSETVAQGVQEIASLAPRVFKK